MTTLWQALVGFFTWGNMVGVFTLFLMALFVGMWIWAWRKKHKNVFDRMAALPMEDDLGTTSDDNKDDDSRG